MKIRKPEYYDRFQCIAGDCKDSCCIGWEIDVDEEKRQLYRGVSGELGERLMRDIDWEEGHFILQGKEERCPFLNKENLCDLIIELGEESLCEICREHPRFYEWYEDLTEAGVGLCCEEAARLILECEEPAAFVVEDSESDFDVPEEEALPFDPDDSRKTELQTLEILFEARETAYQILQNRNRSLWSRLNTFLLYIEELQEALDFENLDEMEESAEYYRNQWKDEIEQDSQPEEINPIDKAEAYRIVLECCKALEPIDVSWPLRLEDLLERCSDSECFDKKEKEMLCTYADRNYEYEHLAVYFVYRYFMKCRIDGDVYSKGIMTVFCILLIRILDADVYIKNGTLTKEDRAMNAKECSKEIEYSEENLEMLANMFWGRPEIVNGLRGLLLCGV